jgi:hypothetical protein
MTTNSIWLDQQTWVKQRAAFTFRFDWCNCEIWRAQKNPKSGKFLKLTVYFVLLSCFLLSSFLVILIGFTLFLYLTRSSRDNPTNTKWQIFRLITISCKIIISCTPVSFWVWGMESFPSNYGPYLSRIFGRFESSIVDVRPVNQRKNPNVDDREILSEFLDLLSGIVKYFRSSLGIPVLQQRPKMFFRAVIEKRPLETYPSNHDNRYRFEIAQTSRSLLTTMVSHFSINCEAYAPMNCFPINPFLYFSFPFCWVWFFFFFFCLSVSWRDPSLEQPERFWIDNDLKQTGNLEFCEITIK